MLKPACLLSALCLLMLSVASKASSFEDSCAALTTSSSVHVDIEPVQIENRIHADDVRLMTVRTTGAESLDKLATVGTTRANPRWDVSYELAMKQDRASSRMCYRPTIHVVIGYDPMRISIADFYPSTTCAYGAIVAHERGHVNIYERFLPGAARAIEQRVSARLADRVRYAADASDIGGQLSQLTSQISAIVADEMSKSEALHKNFDSAQEARRLLDACDGEVRRGLNKEVLSWKSADLQSRTG